MISPEVESIAVSRARLRLALRCLVAAADADPALLTDTSWQRMTVGITSMLKLSPDILALKKTIHFDDLPTDPK